jgi:hypothetical protein
MNDASPDDAACNNLTNQARRLRRRGAQHIARKHFVQAHHGVHGVINNTVVLHTKDRGNVQNAKPCQDIKMLIMDKYNYWASHMWRS